jgi:hypothetical protein
VSGKGKLLIILFIAVGLLSAFGLYHLFALRFEKGDMFPPYSSLRSDPLGCKAFFIALGRQSGLETARNFRDLGKLKGPPTWTIFFLGAAETLLDASADRQTEELEKLAKEGNRVVIALAPNKKRSSAAESKKKPKEDEDGDKGEDSDEDDDEDTQTTEETAKAQSCGGTAGRWGIGLGAFDPPTQQVKTRPRAVLTADVSGLPPAIPLHSRRWLQADDDAWQPVYSYADQQVVLERRIGKGSIVLLADAYLLSNEAMRSDRFPALLAWLQGTNRAALFDESHLGVMDNPGVMSLIRKHRLVPFLVALIALAALYVWKSAVTFVSRPTPDNQLREEVLRDNFSGLVNLLRRNIAPGELLNACYREWSRSFVREIKRSPALEEQVKIIVTNEAARPAGKRDPLARYREIQRRLKAERRSTKYEG